jgi:TetR/AcrR family transcriptional regulator, regulator of autoinduction and epiphytic fitness
VQVHVPDVAPALVPTSPSGPTTFPPIPNNDSPPTDGRIARSHRTIEHIIHALLDLLERDGDLRPTANQVALRAGVSRRALYLHFDSLEALFAAATERRVAEEFATWRPPGPETPVADRIDWFVRQWVSLLEALLPLRRAAALHEPFSHQVSATLDRTRQWAREAVERTFEAELQAVPDDQRETLATALMHATSASAWDDLRRQGADVAQARDAMDTLLRALLT